MTAPTHRRLARPSRRDVLRTGLAATVAGAVGADATVRRVLSAMADVSASATLADVEHVVFVVQENRSFDHYFGRYAGVRGFDDRSVRLRPGDDGTDVFRQRNPGGAGPNPLLPFHIDTTTSPGGECVHDIGHQWVEQHDCWHGGLLDAYVSTHVATEGPVYGPMTMGYYDRRDLSLYYALADAFTVCDSYFTSVISGTVANRLMAVSGTLDPDGRAGGPMVNTPESANQQDYAKMYGACSWRTMPEVLRDAGVSWKFYNPPDTAVPVLNDNYMVLFKQYLTDPVLARGAFASQAAPADFAADCATGMLPAVSWVTSPFLLTEHPPTPLDWGQWFVQQILDALTANPSLWSKTAVFLTWDDSGGFFDHVPPPVPPAGTPGEYLTAAPVVGDDGGMPGPVGLGPRVPMLVISPFSRNPVAHGSSRWRPQVCSDVLDHTSMLRFLVRLFAARGVSGVELPNDTAWRRATVGDLTGAFSFDRADTSVPALPSVSVASPLQREECATAVLTEGPGTSPGSYQPPGGSTPAIPSQEPAPHGVLRPSGVPGGGRNASGAGDAASGSTTAGTSLPGASVTGLPDTLAAAVADRASLVAGAAVAAGAWWARRRRTLSGGD